MKTSESEPTDISHRLREVDQHARLMLVQREAATARPEVVELPAPAVLVAVPRRARAYLLHGAGGGAFAEVTLTAPPRSAIRR